MLPQAAESEDFEAAAELQDKCDMATEQLSTFVESSPAHAAAAEEAKSYVAAIPS